MFKQMVSFALTAALLGGAPGGLAAGAADADADNTPQDLTQYINMAIGAVSDNGSNTVYGPQRPNASVNPSPDTNPQNGCTGYKADGQIRGFSQIHVSGTGVGKYGQFLVSPQVGLATRLDAHDSDKRDESSTCSEYKVNLSRYDIDCAFTPAEHSTIYRFTYPEAEESSLVLDLAHNITDVNAQDVTVQIETDRRGQTVISGSGYYPGGQGPGFNPGGWGEGYSLYFYAVVDTEAEAAGVYDAAGTKPGVSSLGPVNVSDRMGGLGAYMTFATEAEQTVSMKIGVSFTSVDKAREWLEAEIPDWDYEAVREETQRQWNEELNKIVIDGDISEEDKQLFYTAVYHSHVMPRDRTGDLAAYGDADMIDDHFAVWDTWRTLYPLYAITNPDLVAKTVNSFIARSEVNGSVRDSFVAGKEMPAQQGGDDIDNIIADAYAKGIEGIDWDKAYAVIKDNAENHRLDWQGWDTVTPGNSTYKELGYMPGDDTSAVSTCSYLLEYAYNDYCAAQIAKGMGDTENYEKWLARSNNWTNIWNDSLENNGYTGFIWPKAADGEWITDSSMRDPTSWQGSWSRYFYEGSSWTYSFFVPHDVPALIEKMGGEDAFCDRLMAGIERGWVDFGNEPAFLAPYLFSYTDKPYLTTDSVTMLRTKFNLNGVPGNDDSGAMSSWYIFSSMGFFPNAGQNLYYFTSPRYPKTTIHLDNGKSLTLIANNLSDANRYIQSITINGKPYKSTMFTHDVILNGGEIVFEMGSTPVNYAAETAAQLTSVADGPASAVDLDAAGAEWAHFTALDEVNRPAAQAVRLAPEGLTLSGETGEALLDGAYAGFSWQDGAPTATASGQRAFVWSDKGVELPVSWPGGDGELLLYITGRETEASLEVYDGAGGMLAAGQVCAAGEDTVFKEVRLHLRSGGPETFTVRLSSDGDAGGRVGLIAAVLEEKAPCVVRFDPMDGAALPSQHLQPGDKVAEPKEPVRDGYIFAGWYRDDALTESWDFGTDTVESSMTLYAKWERQPGVTLEKITLPQDNTLVNLSEYDDWTHYGDQTHDVIHTDRKDLPAAEQRIGVIQNVDGEREENEYNEGQPFAFTWDDGTPTGVQSTPNRYFSWTRNGLELPLSLPEGLWQCDLYLTGIRARGALEVRDADGNLVLEPQKLWGNTGETRQYRIVTLSFENAQPAAYTVRLLVDKADTELENFSMAIAAAGVQQQSAYRLTAASGANGTVSVRGGETQIAGQTATVTAHAAPGYQFAGWTVERGRLELDRPMENPLSFTMPESDVSLRAVFTPCVAAAGEPERLSRLALVDLDAEGYVDWAYLGRKAGLVRKADAETRIFTGAVTADNNELNGEDMSQTNPDSPYFHWTGGEPVESAQGFREIVWSSEGLRFDMQLPEGQYDVTLYVSSRRAGASLQLLDGSGETILDTKLWDCPGDYRPYYTVTFSVKNARPQTYTVRLLVDGTYADAYSVSLYAAGVTNRNPHVHDYGSQWMQDTEGHWRECACGQRNEAAPHTFETVTVDGQTREVCSVCGYIRPSGGIPGDMDGNGTVDIQDVMAACRVLARANMEIPPSPDEIARGDVTGDGRIAIEDVMGICRILARQNT